MSARTGRTGGAGRFVRVAVGALLVAASVAAMGALTRFQLPPETDRAELRLAWRASVPRVMECREPTAEELAELPVHMRQDEICEGRAVAYRLTAEVDGRVVYRAPVRAEGARADRPLQVFKALPLEPGTRRVRVVFERADSAATSSPSEEMALPDRVVFDRRLRIAPRDVVLITYDADARALRRVGATREDR